MSLENLTHGALLTTAKRQKAEIERLTNRTCEWKLGQYEHGADQQVYKTSCGWEWGECMFVVHEFKYCPGCGGKIVLIPEGDDAQRAN